MKSDRAASTVAKEACGPKPAYIVNSPELVRRILVTEAQAFQRGGVLLDKVKPFVGNGLITLRGATHRRHRRLLQPAFHHSRIARYAEVMRRLAAARADSWEAGQPIAADVEMMELAMAVVGRTLFSMDFDQDEVDEVVRSMPIVLDGVRKRVLAPVHVAIEGGDRGGGIRFPEPHSAVGTGGGEQVRAVGPRYSCQRVHPAGVADEGRDQAG